MAARRAGKLIPAIICLAALLATAGPAQATFNGVNGRVVLQVQTKNRGVQLITADPVTGASRRVSAVTWSPIYPDWSPDGRLIAFTLVPTSGDGCKLRLMRADGTRLRSLTHDRGGCEENPSFTPDGRRIVFVAQRCENCTERIWSMNLRGHDLRQVVDTPPGMHAKDPNVSPNGRLVSFVAENAQNKAGLFVVGIHGRGLRKIVPLSYDIERKHDWAPDGRTLLFDDNANESDLPSNLMTIRPDGTHLTHITHYRNAKFPRKAHVGSYSPDGAWIVYRMTIGDTTKLLRRPVAGGAPAEITLRSDVAWAGNGDWGATTR
jgi:Tol biopolymer transport system component